MAANGLNRIGSYLGRPGIQAHGYFRGRGKMETKNRILLVCRRVGGASCSVQFLEKSDLQYVAVGTLAEARTLFRDGHFDFILAEPELGDGSGMELKGAVRGRSTSLYVAFPVRDGCWWLPVVDAGHECMGQAALRPSEMVAVLMGESPAEFRQQSVDEAQAVGLEPASRTA